MAVAAITAAISDLLMAAGHVEMCFNLPLALVCAWMQPGCPTRRTLWSQAHVNNQLFGQVQPGADANLGSTPLVSALSIP